MGRQSQTPVDRIFPLAEYPAALACMMAGEGFGENPGSGRMMDAERSAFPRYRYSMQTRLRATLRRELSPASILTLTLA